MNEKQIKEIHDEYIELCTKFIKRCKESLEKGNSDKYWHRLKFFLWALMHPEKDNKPSELITNEEWERLCELNEAIIADCYRDFWNNSGIMPPPDNFTRGLRAGTGCLDDIGYIEGEGECMEQ